MADHGVEKAVMENEARNATAISLVDDTYFYYLSEGIIVDPLANDTVPAGSQISSVSRNLFSIGDPTLNSNGTVTISSGREDRYEAATYRVEGPDGSPLGSAQINSVGFSGIPGIGGYTTSKTAEDAFETIGTLTVDLKDYLALSTTPMGDILSVDALMTNPKIDLDARIEGSVVHVDLTPLALFNGESTFGVYLSVETTNGTQTRETDLIFDYFGDPDTGVFVNTASNGILQGGDGNDIVSTRNNAYDVLVGGEGQDEFRFGDYNDGDADHNVIMDFEPGVDSVVFTGSRVTIEKYSEIMDGIIIETVQGDSLTVLGDGVSANTFIGTTAMDNYTIQDDILQGFDTSELSLEFLWAAQIVLFG